MLSFYDLASIEHALTLKLDPRLHRLLAERLSGLLRPCADLRGLTHILVIEPGDSEAAVQQEIGLSPLTNPMDGSRFGSIEFAPWWDWLQDHGGWFEIVISVGDSGFAFVLLIQDAAGAIDDLLAMCREAVR
jgi:hypothetical protein